jgi:hypothetical protein
MVMEVAMGVAVAVIMTAAAEQEHAGDIDDQSEHGDRDRLVEADRHRCKQARDRLVTDEDRDHRQHDGAGEAGEVAELAGAEGEARVVGMAPRIAVGERREQERAGMGRHVQAVGDQRDRAEQQAADDLGDHHDGAQHDHRPGAALVLVMAFAEEDVAVAGCGHGARRLYFR